MNKESSWEECISTNSSISISPDKPKAMSLIDTAKGRIQYLHENKLNEESANYIFEGYYSSVLELLHAILLSRGFKVMNHICIGFYLRDILDRQDLFDLFDDSRFKRNSLIYYGRKMDFDTAKDAITKCKKLIAGLNEIITNSKE